MKLKDKARRLRAEVKAWEYLVSLGAKLTPYVATGNRMAVMATWPPSASKIVGYGPTFSQAALELANIYRNS